MPAKARAGDENHFLRFAEADALAEDCKIYGFDAREQRAVRAHEEPERATAFRIDEIEQLGAILVNPPGAVGLKTEQLAHTQRGFVAGKILRGNAIPREVFLGNVDAAK